MLLTHAIFPLFFPVLHFPIQWKSRLDSDFISTDYSFHLEIPLLRHFCDAADWNRPSGKFEFKKIINIKKEFIWISSDEMDETGADYTEWSKPERKTPIQYTDTYIWNLGRWQWRPCIQDSKKDTDVYNGLLDSLLFLNKL